MQAVGQIVLEASLNNVEEAAQQLEALVAATAGRMHTPCITRLAQRRSRRMRVRSPTPSDRSSSRIAQSSYSSPPSHTAMTMQNNSAPMSSLPDCTMIHDS